MQTDKILARLTAKGVGVPTGESSSGGARSEMDQATIAAALAGLPDPAYWFARARYLDDPDHTRRLWQHLMQVVRDRAVAGAWGDLTEGQVRGLALVAMSPSVWGIMCGTCAGRGHHARRRGVVTVCPTCVGTGRGKASEREQARIAQVPATTWRRVWRVRVSDLIRLVDDLDATVGAHVRRQLR